MKLPSKFVFFFRLVFGPRLHSPNFSWPNVETELLYEVCPILTLMQSVCSSICTAPSWVRRATTAGKKHRRTHESAKVNSGSSAEWHDGFYSASECIFIFQLHHPKLLILNHFWNLLYHFSSKCSRSVVNETLLITSYITLAKTEKTCLTKRPFTSYHKLHYIDRNRKTCFTKRLFNGAEFL